MPIVPPNRRTRAACVSFVLALAGLNAVTPERAALAQQSAPKAPATSSAAENKARNDDVEPTKAIYIEGDIAITRSDLGAIRDKTSFDRTGANGVLYGVSGGLRLREWRFGVRWRVYDTTEFTLWNVGLSAGYGLPLRPVTPIFSLHVGYVFDQELQAGLFRSSLPVGNILPPDVDLKGLLVGLDVNAAYWVTPFLRIGAFIGADVMALHRAKAPQPQSLFGPSPEFNRLPLYTDSGSGIGANVNIGLRGAFDIGLQ